MSGLPSHVFVVRHGNRLDAADKRWHLTSPTPYDPPLTYGGFLQARRVGNQIANHLEQAKSDIESKETDAPGSQPKRRRYRVVIHTSPFLRCVQTSVGISAGLAQGSPDSSTGPSDLLISAPPPAGKTGGFRSAVLRVDCTLGEWLSPEYFENITPPPGSQFMLSGAKADLLKREDYSRYTDFSPPTPTTQSSLWNGSPVIGSLDGPFGVGPASLLVERKGYKAPRPTYAVSGSDKIPDGFVAHARDECLTVDYQWDSMRPPLEFGDGGTLGEEWTTMHKRFRRGLKKMLNWYATAKDPTSMISVAKKEQEKDLDMVEDIETVVIIVSHGAGCNALMGAITHQPVLMDVPTASITMAVRKPDIDFQRLSSTSGKDSLVQIDQLYDIRLSANTEHLYSTDGTPISARSNSVASVRNVSHGSRGRTSTVGISGVPSLGILSYNDPLSSLGSRSTSISGAIESTSTRRESSSRSFPRSMASAGISGASGSGSTGGPPPSTLTPSSSFGLWTPTPSSLRLMDDGNGDEDEDGFEAMPAFDQRRFKQREEESLDPLANPLTERSESSQVFNGPQLAGPIKLQTSWDIKGGAAEEASMTQLGEGMGGLWSQPRPPGEAEKNRDTTTSKRRWTVNER